MKKKELYFTRGAQEFWTRAQGGSLRFFDNHRELSRSGLIPGFPYRIEIDFYMNRSTPAPGATTVSTNKEKPSGGRHEHHQKTRA